MRRTFQIGLFLVFALQIGFAAPPLTRLGRVAGRVNDEKGSPLSGATIFLSSTFDFTRSLLSVVTNREGEFQLANIEPGQYALRVAQNGFRPQVKAPVQVQPGSTTKMFLVLQNLVSLVNPEDPANWDYKTVLRSAQERRLIFRNGEPSAPEETTQPINRPTETELFDSVDKTGQPFARAAALEVFSAGPFETQNYYSIPVRAGAGLRTNFGYSLPLGQDSRYLFAGQVNSGYDSLWKVKNQIDMRLNDFQVWTFSVTYGRIGFPAPRLTTLLDPSNLTRDTEYVTDRGTAQTVTLGVESYNRILEPVTLIYGLDIAILKDTSTRSFATPQVQILVEPTKNLSFRAMMAGKNRLDSDTIKLPSGERVSMSEPFRMSQLNRGIRFDRTLHYEIGVARRLPARTTVEFGTYADRQGGSVLPLIAVMQTPEGSAPVALSLDRRQSNAEGLRVLVDKKLWDFLSSSVAYVYGSGATISGINILDTGSVPGLTFSKDFFHSLTAQVDADFSKTKTHLSTSFRWVPSTPITTLDSFSDIYSMGNGNLRVTVRQVIPVPDLWGMAGRWEALFDLRNVLESDESQYQLPQGNLLVVRNPRFVRLGIAFRM